MGDEVLVWNLIFNKLHGGKFIQKWDYSYIVTSVGTKGSYKIDPCDNKRDFQ